MTMYGTGAATAPRTSQNGQTGHGRAPAVAMPKTRRRTGLAVVGVVGAAHEQVGGPVNILLRPGTPSADELAALGVARISVGSGWYRKAQDAATTALETLFG